VTKSKKTYNTGSNHLLRTCSLILLGSLPGFAQINVLMANGDKERSNASLQETQLAPATVTPAGFGKLGAFPVDGQTYAQALYVSGLAIPGKGAQNVVFLATTHNSVYAYNADSMAPVTMLWHVNLGPSVPSSVLYGPYGDIATEVGILGTGAIDLQRGVLYVVSEVLERGAPMFYLHALDLKSGEERLNGPVAITAAVTTAGSPGNVQFDPQQHIQRPGLLLANNAVYIGFGSHGDSPPWHGWLMSYDASNLTRQLGVYLSTTTGQGGSIWQSGRGPAADDQGNLYAITGNGDYDGVQNFSQSFLKLAGAAPVRVASFTPADWKSMSDNDMDLSAGPALIHGTHTIIGADKIGNLYIVNGDSMGPAGSASSNRAQSVFPVSQDSIFNFAVWSQPGKAYVYVQGEGEGVKCFQVTGSGFQTSPVSVASGTVDYGRIGMTISANGAQNGTGILWETTGDYNDVSAPGTLHAYDASNLAIELWNSGKNPDRDGMGAVAKFVNPTVANGKVYVPTFSNTVVVYGLISQESQVTRPVIQTVANAASYSQDSVAPGELVAIFGSNLGPANPTPLQLDPAGSVATNLAHTRVLFDGVPGPIESTSANQVNAIVPFGLSSPSTAVQVEYQGQVSDPFSIALAPSSPGIFSMNGTGGGQGLILNQDGTVIVFYGTGAGQISPAGPDGAVVTAGSLPQPILSVSAEVGGQPAQVLYAGGSPGFIEGIIQVNLKIPDRAPTGPSVPVVFQVGDQTSQPGLTIALAPPTRQEAPLHRNRGASPKSRQ
jgi:uncharacterized protein (TIGR03437 family)